MLPASKVQDNGVDNCPVGDATAHSGKIVATGLINNTADATSEIAGQPLGAGPIEVAINERVTPGKATLEATE